MDLSSQTVVVQPGRFPRSFHVVAKVVGSRCNLDCTYCYYHYKDTTGRISDDLLEKFIRQYIAGQELDPIVFNWHGGEPAFLGLDFYRKAVELERKYAEGKRIQNDFQTNGVLLDETWCEFFKEHGFYVGLSIDGPKHLHDQFRMDSGRRPSFDRVYKAAQLLRQYRVPFNALTVVSAANARHPDEVYGFLTEELGCDRLQWLPCVGHTDFRTAAPGYWDPVGMPVIGTAAAKPGQNWFMSPDYGRNSVREVYTTFEGWPCRHNWHRPILAGRVRSDF